MKTIYDLSQLEWKLSGWTPYYWRMQDLAAFATSPNAEITTLPAKVPGSVQYVLKEQGLIPDWNVGLNGRQCEWIENRHWLYEAVIPREWIEPGKTIRLRCLGLDYSGWVYVNGSEVAYFKGAHIPHVFDLTPHICDGENILRIVFDLPPRWLGQFGFTEEMKDWKARFNYTWDWVVRLVQIGIWDDISLEVTDGREISEFRCYTDVDPKTCAGAVVAVGRVNDSSGAKVRLTIAKDGQVKHQQELLANSFNSGGINAMGFEVDLWWPNLHGPQPLYDISFELLDGDGDVLDSVTRRVGFKKIEWAQNEGAPEGADPYIPSRRQLGFGAA
jgi:beta-mannosidase